MKKIFSTIIIFCIFLALLPNTSSSAEQKITVSVRVIDSPVQNNSSLENSHEPLQKIVQQNILKILKSLKEILNSS